MKRASGLAIVAGLALVPLDYAIAATALVYRPTFAEIMLAVVGALFVSGVAFRRSALIYASQIVAIAPLVVRMIERPQDVGVDGLVIAGVATAGVAALAWIVSRGLRGRPNHGLR